MAICTLDDMETLFRDIPLEKITTSMTINATAPWLLALYVAVAERQGVDPSQLVEGGVALGLALEVHHLPAGQADVADGLAQPADDVEDAVGGNILGIASHVLEGGGEEGVAGENGNGLVELPVTGKLAPAVHVIVHRGEVVVDERIGVDKF